jgi:hypothetical protein
MIMFVIKNLDHYQTNDSVHSKHMRQENQLHLQSVSLSLVQKGVCCFLIRIFNKLPSHIVQLLENTMAFKTCLNTLK